jgi:hypothetical protein
LLLFFEWAILIFLTKIPEKSCKKENEKVYYKSIISKKTTSRKSKEKREKKIRGRHGRNRFKRTIKNILD